MLAAVLIAMGSLASAPILGTTEGRCRAGESGPAFIVDVAGLADRNGLIRVELYPADNDDFLADDNLLIGAGKTFARVERAVPQSGAVEICIRAPSPGVYAMVVLHDRDSNRKFGFSVDGVAFPGNPRLGWRKPAAAQASARTEGGVTRFSVRMNYRKGLLSFGPLQPRR